MDGCRDLADARLVDARTLTVKKYIDEVFTTGHGKLYHSDGRHRVNPTEGYGTGGLLQGKNTCFRLRGMRRLKRSPVKAISSKAKA